LVKRGGSRGVTALRRPERGFSAGGKRNGRLLATALSIFALAWLLRFLFILDLRASPLVEAPMLDEYYHVEWAKSLAGGDWIGSEAFFRAPLYPYLLGVLFVVFKGSVLAARIVQATYGALTPVALFFLSRRVLPRAGAAAAAAVACLYPFLIYFDNELLIVSLVVLLDLVLLIAIVRADEAPTWGRWLGAGILMGLSAIARPNILVFAPVVLAWAWWRERSRGGRARRRGRVAHVCCATPARTAAARFALFAVGVAIVVAPVTVRNYVLDHDFVPIASQGGVNFYIGNNEHADGISALVPELGIGWQTDEAIRFAEQAEGRPLKPSEFSDYWYRRAWGFILGHPGAAARLLFKKLVLFWDRFELANNKDIYYFARMSIVYRALRWLSFGLIAPLAILGMWVSRRNPVAALLIAFVVSYMLSVLAFFINARYRLPVVPCLILFSVAGAWWLGERFLRRDIRSLAVGALAVGILATAVNADFYGTHIGDRAQTHNTLGLAHARVGRYAEAIPEYLRAIELSPGYSDAYNNMGRSFESLGRIEEAGEAYRKAAEVDPGNAEALNNVGAFLMRTGDLEGAESWLRKAIELNPRRHEAQANLAAILAARGDLAGAEAHYRLAVEANAGFKEAWNALGEVLEVEGKAPHAIAAYTRAVAIDPTYVQARNNLAVLLALTGQYEEALIEFEEALRCAPGDKGIADNLDACRKLARESREQRRRAGAAGPAVDPSAGSTP
jgi:Flp pilus assembly protein TadD